MFPHRLLTAAVLGVATAATLLTPSSWAQVDFSYGFNVSNLNLTPGASGQVEVYLRETTATGATSILVSEDGLSSAQFTVSRQPSMSLTDPATLTDAMANVAEFNDIFGPTVTVFGDQVDVLEYLDLLEPVGPTGTDLGGGVREVLVGTLTLQAGLVVGEVSLFTAADDPAFDDTLTVAAGTILDQLIASNSFTVTVIPVPEPAAGLLLLVGGVACVVRRRR